VPDLASQVLEVVIAVAFVYFVLSLVASAITEAVAAILRLRARTLESGLRELIADREKAEALFDQPLVSQMTKGKKRRTPSYLSPRNFALALIDTIAPPPAGSTPGSRNVLAAVAGEIDSLPDSLKRQLYPLVEEAQGDLQRFRTSVEAWFNDSMDRVSGWYKRRSQLVVYLVAAALSVGLNVDTVRITDRLWDDNALRESVVRAAIETAREPQTAETTHSAGPENGVAAAPEEGATAKPSLDRVEQAVDEAQASLSSLEELQLPIGWNAANDDVNGSTVIGWLVSFFAVSLGAPFWFDALSRLAHLRSTGPAPKASPTGTGGA
jgi:hypothetical protein